MDRDEGPCNAYFKRFYHDKATNECQLFTYGGCEGNKNNFKTLEACKKICKPRQKGGKEFQDYVANESERNGIFSIFLMDANK